MFERFTGPSRAVVVDAQAVARELDSDWIGTGHLLLAVSRGPGATADALAAHGLDPATIRAWLEAHGRGNEIDADALRSVGVDLDVIRERVEGTFGAGALDPPSTDAPARGTRRSHGRGHIPFTNDAKQSLELALRAAVDLGHREIRPSHLALGILTGSSGAGGRLMAQSAVPGLRESLVAAARPAA